MTVNASKGTASDLPHFRATYVVTQTEALHRIHTTTNANQWGLDGAGCFLSSTAVYISGCVAGQNTFTFIKAIFQTTTCPKWPFLLDFPFCSAVFYVISLLTRIMPTTVRRIRHPGKTDLQAIMLMWLHNVSVHQLQREHNNNILSWCVVGNLTWLSSLMWNSIYVLKVFHYW